MHACCERHPRDFVFQTRTCVSTQVWTGSKERELALEQARKLFPSSHINTSLPAFPHDPALRRHASILHHLRLIAFSLCPARQRNSQATQQNATTKPRSRMAAKSRARVLIARLVSTAGTGYFYATKRLRTADKLAKMKYDPVGECPPAPLTLTFSAPVCQAPESPAYSLRSLLQGIDSAEQRTSRSDPQKP